MRKLFTLVIVAVILAMGLVSVRTASAASVTPTIVEGNPTCTGLGYTYGLKFDYPEDSKGGTFPIGTGTVTWSTGGTYVTWSSTFGIDAVIMKGGPQANVYAYVPESFGDSGLVSPINSSGTPAGLSHVEFCYDYELVVSKTANTTYTRTYTWEIVKSVDPDSWNLFTGDSGTSLYKVAVTRNAVDSDFAVSGTITIKNPDPTYPAKIVSVIDTITTGIPADVVCPAWTVPPGGILECTYSKALPNKDPRENEVVVTTTGKVGGGTGTAPVTFGNPTTVKGYPEVTVNDTNGMSWKFTGSGEVTYEKTFTCNADKGEHVNTATIFETGQSASATVMVNCYALEVKKDAKTSLTRTWTWDIKKTGDKTNLMLPPGQFLPVNYEVTVDATAIDSAWAVAGKIWVYNPAPMAAEIKAVTDVVSPDIAAMVDCPAWTVPAGGTLECTYKADLPDAADRTNTAKAVLQNYAYDSLKAATPAGTTTFWGTANVSFADAVIKEIDKCVYVTDDKYGDLGKVCANEAPKTFKYTIQVGGYEVCSDMLYKFTNIASFITYDTKTPGSDDWTVEIKVPCKGCTLTQGYWKTHSKYGPAAKSDDTWYKLSQLGPDTPFFTSGKTWHQVFWTAPAGNPYYTLARQYMAAIFNKLNNASSTPEVDAALISAETYLMKSPTTQWSKADKAAMTALASLLDRYNNGLIGPGHCSE